MSEQNSSKEISLTQLFSGTARWPGVAALCLLLTTFLPCVIFMVPRNSMMSGLIPNGMTLSGYSYVGFWLFLPILAFAAATATRIMADFAQYRKIADQIAFVIWLGVAIYACMGGEMSSGEQGLDLAREFSGSSGPLFIILPYFGAIFFLAAPILLFIAKRREKRHAG